MEPIDAELGSSALPQDNAVAFHSGDTPPVAPNTNATGAGLGSFAEEGPAAPSGRLSGGFDAAFERALKNGLQRDRDQARNREAARAAAVVGSSLPGDLIPGLT